MIDLSLVFGLGAAFCWGSADFVAKLSSAKIGYVRTTFYMQLVGLLFMLAITTPDIGRLARYPHTALVVVALGVVNVLGTLALYKSFEVGQVSLMSPIASSYPALSSILAFIFLNEKISQMRLLAVVSIFVGLMLVSSHGKATSGLSTGRMATGAVYAFAALGCMGVLFFGLKLVVSDLGGLLPTIVLRLVAVLVMVVVMFSSRSRLSAISRSGVLCVIFVGVVDSLANVAYNVGVSFGSVTIVSFVSSLFSAVTLILAMTILRERVTRYHALGIVCIMMGIVLIGSFS
jgi:drug/metabolite transporter (DMT)-like permease